MADIVLDGVYKTYSDGYTAVKDLNLEIADGEFMILVGPSGCGKSTALNMIAGLEDITAGELRIGGEVVNKKAPRDRDIAMVFQSYALYPHMTVRDNIAFALKLAKTPKEEIDRKVNDAAEILDLQNHLERKPANLSGGQRQRVAMGRAIVRSPKAFLMDEPLSNLDAKLRVQMRAEVARIQHRLDVTTVYVTHDQTEAMTLGDRVAIMLSGELQQVASPMELYNNPRNLFVAGFIGSPGMNFLPATIDGDSAKLPMVSVQLPQEIRERIGRVEPGKKLIAGIRPEDFEDATRVPAETRARGTTFQAKFDLVEAMGAEFYVHFGVKADQMTGSSHMDALMEDQGGISESGDEGEAVVVARLDAESRAKTGEQTEVWIDSTKLHFFDADSGRALSAK
ncbi:ABC transporter ATP-binding protein [Solirubrobacter soli]|uniref:ABC transporter ATP-binding protein n=1 Tax=Solirubrobacter soli TaxID=363832 RepID=UPI0004091333|nr:sn-glycerol-3-phosphate ABC transporter ATP-binding protein UgpC [Solirubrobacter soli]